MNTPIQDFFAIAQASSESEVRDWLLKNSNRFSPSTRDLILAMFEEFAHEKRFNPRSYEESDETWQHLIRSMGGDKFEQMMREQLKRNKSQSS